MHTFFDWLFIAVPESATRQVDDTAQEDEFGAKDYRTTLSLKNDHSSRPLFVVSTLLDLYRFVDS